MPAAKGSARTPLGPKLIGNLECGSAHPSLFHLSAWFHVGDGLNAAPTGALCEEDANVGKSSQPGNEFSYGLITFLFR
jgi:hypothetical protein